jgi:hypothetical protein
MNSLSVPGHQLRNWAHDSLGHVRLDVPPALPDLAEDGGVAADDGDAGHQEAEQHQELLRRLVVFPGTDVTIKENIFAKNLVQKLAFFTQTTSSYCKNWIRTIFIFLTLQSFIPEYIINIFHNMSELN